MDLATHYATGPAEHTRLARTPPSASSREMLVLARRPG